VQITIERDMGPMLMNQFVWSTFMKARRAKCNETVRASNQLRLGAPLGFWMVCIYGKRPASIHSVRRPYTSQTVYQTGLE